MGLLDPLLGLLHSDPPSITPFWLSMALPMGTGCRVGAEDGVWLCPPSNPPCRAGTRGDVLLLLNVLSLRCPPPSFTHGCMHSLTWGGCRSPSSPSLWGSPIALVVAQGYTEHNPIGVPPHPPQALLGEEGKGFGTH